MANAKVSQSSPMMKIKFSCSPASSSKNRTGVTNRARIMGALAKFSACLNNLTPLADDVLVEFILLGLLSGTKLHHDPDIDDVMHTTSLRHLCVMPLNEFGGYFFTLN